MSLFKRVFFAKTRNQTSDLKITFFFSFLNLLRVFSHKACLVHRSCQPNVVHFSSIATFCRDTKSSWCGESVCMKSETYWQPFTWQTLHFVNTKIAIFNAYHQLCTETCHGTMYTMREHVLTASSVNCVRVYAFEVDNRVWWIMELDWKKCTWKWCLDNDLQSIEIRPFRSR